MKNVVSVNWLSKHIDDPNMVILDCRLSKPKTAQVDESLNKTFLVGARNFDLNRDFSKPNTNLPHMMPSEEHFNKAAQALGISNESKIVVYDQFGIYSSPRVWWMFKAMGHQHIAVLDGGLPAWVKSNMPTQTQITSVTKKGYFNGTLDSRMISHSEEVLSQIASQSHLILDARSTGRFAGTEPEPRAGLKGGHIPNSKNLPFQAVLAAGHYKNKAQLKTIFETLDIKDQALTFSCGSGITACIIALAANLAGYTNFSVYDGSWSEWGQLDNYPVST